MKTPTNPKTIEAKLTLDNRPFMKSIQQAIKKAKELKAIMASIKKPL